MKHRHGFTLLEVMLSLAVVGIMSAVSVPVLSRVQTKNDLDAATRVLVQSLRRAEILAQSVDGDTSWGVSAQSGSITLFKGPSFAGRDSTYDEIFTVPTTVTATGLTEVVMAKFTGYPTTTGSVTLTSSVLPDTSTVTIQAKGTVTY